MFCLEVGWSIGHAAQCLGNTSLRRIIRVPRRGEAEPFELWRQRRTATARAVYHNKLQHHSLAHVVARRMFHFVREQFSGLAAVLTKHPYFSSVPSPDTDAAWHRLAIMVNCIRTMAPIDPEINLASQVRYGGPSLLYACNCLTRDGAWWLLRQGAFEAIDPRSITKWRRAHPGPISRWEYIYIYIYMLGK